MRLTGEQRRAALTAAAVRVLVEEGPAALTTRRVAERAGASLGTVHYAFRGKDELLEAAAAELLGTFAGALRAAVRPGQGVRAAVDAVLDGYRAWLTADAGRALAFAETFVATLRTGTAAGVVGDAHALVLDLLRAAAAHDPAPPGTPLEDLAHLVLIAADGLTLVHLATRDDAGTTRHARHLAAALRALP